jgi:hypothetical protein
MLCKNTTIKLTRKQLSCYFKGINGIDWLFSIKHVQSLFKNDISGEKA